MSLERIGVLEEADDRLIRSIFEYSGFGEYGHQDFNPDYTASDYITFFVRRLPLPSLLAI